jgi:hypothetical protein
MSRPDTIAVSLRRQEVARENGTARQCKVCHRQFTSRKSVRLCCSTTCAVQWIKQRTHEPEPAQIVAARADELKAYVAQELASLTSKTA